MAAVDWSEMRSGDQRNESEGMRARMRLKLFRGELRKMERLERCIWQAYVASEGRTDSLKLPRGIKYRKFSVEVVNVTVIVSGFKL
ncbi:hypothetical protein VNO77_17674 [Canavalia gladiata]|uniref:Uncharacterized protein n=1 Tax=Canavalia gladiata TaxID=3824 RepID=A0AAN9QGV1_CANGL